MNAEREEKATINHEKQALQVSAALGEDSATVPCQSVKCPPLLRHVARPPLCCYLSAVAFLCRRG